MIALLTIGITTFIVINFLAVAVIFLIDELDMPDIIYNISKIFLLSEGALVILGIIIFISYLISGAIVCSTTNNDYKGCPIMEVKE